MATATPPASKATDVTAEPIITLYEGLFLMSPTAGADLAGSLAHIREILDRAEAEIVTLRKWDERRLAYTIKGQKRGLYIIAYFKVQRNRLVNIDRDCNLSEQVVRAMVVRTDHLGETEIEAEIKEAEKTSTEVALKSDGDAKPAEEKAAAPEAEASTESASETPETPETPEAPAADAPAESGDAAEENKSDA